MKTLQIEVDIKDDRRLTVQLPDDVEPGVHKIVLGLQAQETAINSSLRLNELAGKIQSFNEIDPVV